jgi:hypothetical protein
MIFLLSVVDWRNNADQASDYAELADTVTASTTVTADHHGITTTSA